MADASGAYFAWRHFHPREAEDPSAVWGAAWKAGGRAAMHDSARIVELVPLLRDLLFLLEDGYVEDQVRASDNRVGVPIFGDRVDSGTTISLSSGGEVAF